MRSVYYGKTASGKTRECERLANIYKKEGLFVVSNIPTIFNPTLLSPDVKKKNVVLSYNRILLRVYNNEFIKEYGTAGSILIKQYINYLICEGDVLILDDLDSQLPNYITGLFAHILKEGGYLDPLWKHVILTGYDWSLTNLIENLNENHVNFVGDDGMIAEIFGKEDVKEKHYEMLYT